MAETIQFIEFADNCGYYNGFKEDHDEDQCKHPQMRSVGASWCEECNCPRIAEYRAAAQSQEGDRG